MNKLAVLMSIYNETETEIMQSVNSILNQTYKDFVLIIVYDNPKDDKLKKVVDKLKNKDKRITILYNEKNIGLAMSMNKAFDYANAKYVARMDADDIAEKDRLEKEIKILESGYDFVYSNYVYIDELGNEINKDTEIYSEKITKKILPYRNTIHHPTVMFTSEIFEKSGKYRNFPCSQDYDLWLRFKENNAKMYAINDVLLKYRVRENSTSQEKMMKQIATLKYMRKLYKQRQKNGKDDYSINNYNNYIEKLGVNNETKKQEFKKYKAIQEQGIKLYSEGNKLKGIIYQIHAMCKCSYLFHY